MNSDVVHRRLHRWPLTTIEVISKEGRGWSFLGSWLPPGFPALARHYQGYSLLAVFLDGLSIGHLLALAPGALVLVKKCRHKIEVNGLGIHVPGLSTRLPVQPQAVFVPPRHERGGGEANAHQSQQTRCNSHCDNRRVRSR